MYRAYINANGVGITFEYVAEDYVATPGEQLFSDAPSEAELAEAFPQGVAAATTAARKAGIVDQIEALEAKQHRALRENALGQPGAAARLQALDSEIVALRAQL